MVQWSGFFADAVGDVRRYAQGHFAGLIRVLTRSGVAHLFAGGLQVGSTIPPTRAINLSTGVAIVNGYIYQNSETITLPIAAADPVDDRIDRVVLRLDENGDREIVAMVITGAPAASPLPPALVRANGIYDIGLATVLVAKGASTVSLITDTRPDTDVCGWVQPWRVTQASWYPTGPVNNNGQKLTNLAPGTAAGEAYTFDQAVANINDLVQSRIFAGDLMPFAGHYGALTDLGADHSSPASGTHIYGRRTYGIGEGVRPVEWLLCNGAVVRKETFGSETRDIGYNDAFLAIGDAYGSAPSSLFFRLPDFRGRAMVFYKDDMEGYDAVGRYVPSLRVEPDGEGQDLIPNRVTAGGVLIKV